MPLTKTLKTKLAGTLIVVVVSVLALPAFAAAQQVSPTNDQYKDTAELIVGGGSGGNEQAAPSEAPSGLGGNVGPLPFTGFDVIAMAAVALAVTGLGLALQRAVSGETT